MSSDLELVGLARRGDAASMGLLLERYRAPLATAGTEHGEARRHTEALFEILIDFL